MVRDAVVPRLGACGARVHQFGIDGRLCWAAGRVEWPFPEFQFGIG